jgi:hypothetical protein
MYTGVFRSAQEPPACILQRLHPITNTRTNNYPNRNILTLPQNQLYCQRPSYSRDLDPARVPGAVVALGSAFDNGSSQLEARRGGKPFVS